MVDGVQVYSRQITTENGYTLTYPEVASGEALLQSYPVNPYAESSTQLFPLGTKAARGERVFRYCKNGASALTTLGTFLQAAAPFHAEAEDDIVPSAISAIGAYTVSLTSTANLAAAPLSTANGFAEGYLIINDGTGEGQMYKIKSHGAASGTSTFVVTLYDPLTVAIAGTNATEVGIMQNPYANVIATAAPITGVPIGVNLIAVTASYYFWAQSGGPAPVNCNAAITKATAVTVGITAAKVDPVALNITNIVIVGYMMTPGVAATEKAICKLILDG